MLTLSRQHHQARQSQQITTSVIGARHCHTISGTLATVDLSGARARAHGAFLRRAPRHTPSRQPPAAHRQPACGPRSPILLSCFSPRGRFCKDQHGVVTHVGLGTARLDDDGLAPAGLVKDVGRGHE